MLGKIRLHLWTTFSMMCKLCYNHVTTMRVLLLMSQPKLKKNQALFDKYLTQIAENTMSDESLEKLIADGFFKPEGTYPYSFSDNSHTATEAILDFATSLGSELKKEQLHTINARILVLSIKHHKKSGTSKDFMRKATLDRFLLAYEFYEDEKEKHALQANKHLELHQEDIQSLIGEHGFKVFKTTILAGTIASIKRFLASGSKEFSPLMPSPKERQKQACLAKLDQLEVWCEQKNLTEVEKKSRNAVIPALRKMIFYFRSIKDTDDFYNLIAKGLNTSLANTYALVTKPSYERVKKYRNEDAVWYQNGASSVMKIVGGLMMALGAAVLIGLAIASSATVIGAGVGIPLLAVGAIGLCSGICFYKAGMNSTSKASESIGLVADAVESSLISSENTRMPS